jgi:predicted GH43/DUF377 family glycosyl hydrolase
MKNDISEIINKCQVKIEKEKQKRKKIFDLLIEEKKKTNCAQERLSISKKYLILTRKVNKEIKKLNEKIARLKHSQK